MKKTAISLALVLAMVVGFVLLPAPAVSAAETHPHGATTTHCVCGGSLTGKHTCENVTDWKVLSSTAEFSGTGNSATVSFGDAQITGSTYTVPAGNHYLYLKENTRVICRFDVPAGANVTLCLNGYQLTPRNSASSVARLFKISGGTVNICDCGTGGSLAGKAGYTSTNQTAHGGVVSLEGANSTLNVFGGEMKYAGSKLFSNGGLIYASADATNSAVNIYGGKLTAPMPYADSKTIGNGNMIYMETGTVNVYGGELVAGTPSVNRSAIHIGEAASLNWGGETLTFEITKMGLEVDENGNVGVGYVTEFNVPEELKSQLTNSSDFGGKAFGLKLWLTKLNTESGKYAAYGDPAYLGYTAEDDFKTTVRQYLSDIMVANESGDYNSERAAYKVNGVAFMSIDGVVIESETKSFTLQTLIEKMDSKLDTANLEILADLYKLYQPTMEGWNIPNIKAKAA